jgi:hypothetical protein
LVVEAFPGYRFVPHWFYDSPVENFMVPYSDEESNVIFNGIFSQEYRRGSNILGDEYYRADKWVREGFVDTGGAWTSYPPRGS